MTVESLVSRWEAVKLLDKQIHVVDGIGEYDIDALLSIHRKMASLAIQRKKQFSINGAIGREELEMLPHLSLLSSEK